MSPQQASLLVVLTLTSITTTTSSASAPCRVQEPKAITRWLVPGDGISPVNRVVWRCGGGAKTWTVQLVDHSGEVKVSEEAKFPKPSEKYLWFLSLPPEGAIAPAEGYRIRIQAADGTVKIQSSEFGIVVFKPLPPPASNKTGNEQLAERRLKTRERKSQELTEMARKLPLPSPESCNMRRVTGAEGEVMRGLVKEGKPFIVRDGASAWPAVKSWGFEELEKKLHRGIRLPQYEHSTPMAKWNKFMKENATGLEENFRVLMTEFFDRHPELLGDVGDTDDITEELNYLKLVDDDLLSRNRVEFCPKRHGHGWQVNRFNASLFIAQTTGRRRLGLYSRAWFFVPGVLHNWYFQPDDQGSVPLYWWHHTLPALEDRGRPDYDCVISPGEVVYVPSGSWFSSLCLDDGNAVFADAVTISNLREVLDELRTQADSDPHNYCGDIFVQLREKIRYLYPDVFSSVFTKEDETFVPPKVLEGPTWNEFKEKMEEAIFYNFYNESAVMEYVETKNKLDAEMKEKDKLDAGISHDASEL